MRLPPVQDYPANQPPQDAKFSKPLPPLVTEHPLTLSNIFFTEMLKEQAQVQRLAVPQDATRLSGRLQAVVMAHQATKCFAQSNLPLRALEQAIPVSHDSAQDQGPYPQIVLALPVHHSVVGSDAPQVIKVLAPR